MGGVSPLWDEPWFRSLRPFPKLIYLYCRTRPGINTLGLFVSTPEEIAGHTRVDTGTVISCLEELMSIKRVLIKKDKGITWFWVTDFVKGFPKKGARFETGVKQYDKLPTNIKIWVHPHLPKMKVVDNFRPPTPEEVTKHALELGHIVDGETFVDWYAKDDWKDRSGKKIRNWKTKVSRVWCKDENKIHPVIGAPKGQEFFYVMSNGKPIFPKRWRGGKPFGNSIVEDKLLQKEYETTK